MRFVVFLSVFHISLVSTFGQGTVNFMNRVTGAGGVDAPFYYIDGVTKLAGTAFLAQLYAGPTPTTLEPIGAPLHFRTGTGAGYLHPGGEDWTRVIPTVGIGEIAWIEVRAWEVATGATWESAWIRGASPMFSQVTGGVFPSVPTTMVGLQSFSLQVVPEPSPLPLMTLGGLLLAWKLRCKSKCRRHPMPGQPKTS